jgi:RND superfamily putative drug exporter
MSQLARWCYRNRRRVLALWSAALVALFLAGTLLGGTFQNDFRIEGAESQASFELLQERFPEFYGDPLSVAFRAEAGVADPAVQAEMEGFFAAIAALDGVRQVISPYGGGPAPISPDGTIGFAQVQLEDFGPTVAPELVRGIIDQADALSEASGLEVNVGGPTAMFAEMEPPGGREGAGVLLALVILVVTFGSVIAAGLPILVAVCGLAAGMSLVLLSTRVVEVFTFAPAMAAMIGLGVGIDYALFIVTRYRQGLDAGMEPEDAVALSLDTSGRAVIFAGATVVISMLGMVLMGVSMVVGMATSAALAVVCTVVAAITLLPAMLGFAGGAIDHLSIRGLRHTDNPDRETLWHRWGREVQRRPWPALLASLTLLLTLSWPALDIELGGPQFGAGPESHSSRRAYDLITDGFGEGFNGPLVLVAETDPAQPSHRDALTRLIEAVGRTDGVVAVAPPITNAAGDTAVITVIPATAPHSHETEQIVHRLRDEVIPAAMGGTGVDVGVSGVTALFVDMAELLNRRLPLFIGTVLVLSFLLLLVVFRSVLVPLKAALMNLLSIGAAYGVVVAVFQWGWGKDLIGVERTGPIMAFIPMMLFAILFGLSMDYEVFLLSRVREEYDRTGDNALAVVDGLAATARVITAAAAIMVTIFFSFVLGDDPIVKTFGLGLAVAVFVDATVVRMVLVPATMELLGDANWWFPAWLDRLVPTVSLEAEHQLVPVAPSRVLVVPRVVDWLESLDTADRGRALAYLEARLRHRGPVESDEEIAVPLGRRSRRLVLEPLDGSTGLLTLPTRDARNSGAYEWDDVRSHLLDEEVRIAYEGARLASEIGGLAAAMREAKGLTPAQLAARADTSQATVEQFERGSGRVDLEALARVSLALGAQVDFAPSSATPNRIRNGVATGREDTAPRVRQPR